MLGENYPRQGVVRPADRPIRPKVGPESEFDTETTLASFGLKITPTLPTVAIECPGSNTEHGSVHSARSLIAVCRASGKALTACWRGGRNSLLLPYAAPARQITDHSLKHPRSRSPTFQLPQPSEGTDTLYLFPESMIRRVPRLNCVDLSAKLVPVIEAAFKSLGGVLGGLWQTQSQHVVKQVQANKIPER